jgi:hypothetical protein
MVCDCHDSFLILEVFALLLGVVGTDGFWVIVTNESSIAELISEGFCAANVVIEILEFGANSLNVEINASFAFCLCLWSFDQWLDRIVFKLGVR